MSARLITALFALLVQNASSVPFQPSGKWAVKYGPTYCEARREFAEENSTLTLTIRVAPTNASAIVSISMPQLKEHSSLNEHAQGVIDFASSGQTSKVNVSIHTYNGQSETSFWPDRSMLKVISAKDVVGLSFNGIRQKFELSGMPTVVQALDDCEQKLLASWGADAASVEAAASLPQPKNHAPAAWFGADAYPADAIASNAQGVAIISLSVNESGKVVSCKVLKSSGTTSLDRASCAPMLGHGSSFRPALSKMGTPVPIDLVLPIVWTSREHSLEAEKDAPFGVIITGR